MSGVQSPTLKRVLRSELCSGCGLCVGISDGAVEMETIAPGYSRPRQNAPVTPQVETAIATACPGAKVMPWTEGPNRHEYWGPWRQCLTGHATDDDVRFSGSSGGAISALAIHALSTGLAERVLHVSADPDYPTRNRIIWSKTPDEVIAGAGSRYASSSPLASINEALEEGKPFVFIGKPCDVSALRQLATVDDRVDALIPLKLSFFCGGMPSHDGADRVVRAMGMDPAEITSFRYRGNGWPGLTRAETQDGQFAEMRYEDSWGGHLSKEIQFRCKICPDAVGGVADIACADAWYGGESGYPKFEEQDGRSLIMTRTEIGENFLNDAVTGGILATEKLAIEEVQLMQPAQARRKRLVASRLAACSLMLQPRPAMNGLDVEKASRAASIKEKLKNLLGTMRRIGTNQR